MVGRFDVEWATTHPDLKPYEAMFENAASALKGKVMKQIGNLRRNRLTEGASISPHDDGRVTDEDIVAVLFLSGPDKGGEFVVRLKPHEGALVLIPATAVHAVLQIESGTRESVTAVMTPVEGG